MAKKKPTLAAADAAYLRNLEQLEPRAPVPPGTLLGQIDMITGDVAGFPRTGTGKPIDERRYPELDLIPTECPGCMKTMHIESGWTALHAGDGDAPKVQCGQCGYIAVVPANAWRVLKLAIAARYTAVDRYRPPVKKEKKGKPRGAG